MEGLFNISSWGWEEQGPFEYSHISTKCFFSVQLTFDWLILPPGNIETATNVQFPLFLPSIPDSRNVSKFKLAPATHTTGLYYTSLHYIEMYCTALHCILLKCTSQNFTEFYCIRLHGTSLHCTTMHWTTIPVAKLHSTILHFTALLSTTLHLSALHLL